MNAIKRVVIVLWTLAFVIAMEAYGQAPGTHVEGELLVKFRPGVGAGAIERTARRYGAKVLSMGRMNGVHRVSVPPGRTVAHMVKALSKNPNVAFAEPNFIATAHVDALAPVDDFYIYQWNLHGGSGGIGMEQAWGWLATNNTDGGPGGDSNVVVAVVDTGVAYEDYQEIIQLNRNKTKVVGNYYRAPDLSGTSFVPGYDFVNNDAHPNDDEGHGTHVTGTIAQSTSWTGSGYGVAGVAPDVSIMPVKVLGADGSGTYFDIADGIEFAADNGAAVINMSLGGSSGSATLEAAVAYAHGMGVTIICSAGNSGYSGTTSTVGYPAAYGAYCIAVSATDYAGDFAYYSSGGSEVDIAAPGGDVYADLNGDGYGDGILQETFGDATNDWGFYFYQGTSMAAPHVAGVAGLLISSGVAGPAAVRAALEGSARDLGAPGVDTYYGHGLLDPYAALIGAVVEAPDAAVSLAALPAAVLASSPSAVTVDVVNAGNADAADVVVALFDDGVLVGTEDVGVLAQGTGTAVTFTWTPVAAVPETHELRAEVSATDDGNPGNDVATGSVLVTPYTTNIKVVGMVAPATTTVGQAEGVDVTVANQGLTQEIFFLTLADDSVAPADSQEVTLQAGEVQIVTFDWTAPDTAGNYTLAATAVVTDEVSADNTVVADVTVSDVTTIHVSGIDMRLIRRAVFTSAEATITIVNAGGDPVSGAQVFVTWGGDLGGTDSGLTDGVGQAVLTSGSIKKAEAGAQITVTVTNVSADGMLYEPPITGPPSAEVVVP